MKPHLILASVIVLGVFTSCKKNKATTSYETMGSFDISGLPSYLSTPDSISQSLSDYLDTTLPSGVNLVTSHPEFFQGYQNADIDITQTSQVSIIFVSEACNANNALGFYTYLTGQPPKAANDLKTITYIYPNTGAQTPLQPGDKVILGKFDAGTTIGLVVLVNAWSSSQHALNNNVTKFYSDDALNPETNSALQKHAVKIYYAPDNKTIISFEDTNRKNPSCDNDFNDAVFYCTVTPSP